MSPSLWESATSTVSDSYDAVAGTADHLAGSTDEAVARTFDDTEGGGILDGTTETAGDVYDTIAGTADHLAGSTDEAFHRQFDDTPGGGLFDEIAGAGEDAANRAGPALVDMAGALASFQTDLAEEVGSEVFGEWFQWWMPLAGLLVLAYLFKDELSRAGSAYATGGASEVTRAA
ncbi:hypothetical protein [Haloarchaeobius sp. HRN-SO-5]|uniref:hypothetical protein n=1 Tax=Haloarchaeobius sp. HRN-SO-5 TaxID=3446118 RepID=UPI003EC11DE3